MDGFTYTLSLETRREVKISHFKTEEEALFSSGYAVHRGTYKVQLEGADMTQVCHVASQPQSVALGTEISLVFNGHSAAAMREPDCH